jgi:hypothetical protein
MTFDLPDHHPLSHHVKLCRALHQKPLVTRPICDVEQMLQVPTCP